MSTLKEMYLSLQLKHIDRFREEVMASTKWSRGTWHNKLHNKTQLSGAEELVIQEIYNKYSNE